MSANEVPPAGAGLALLFVSAPFLALGLRRAARRLAAGARPADRWPSAEAGAVLLLPFFVVALVGLFVRPSGGAALDPLTVLLGSQLVFGSACLLAVGLARRRPEGLAGLGLGTTRPRGVPGAVLAVYLPGFFFAAGVGVLWARLSLALGWEVSQEVLRMILELEGLELLLAAGIAVFVAPFLEELLFRGFLQGFMAQVVGERWGLLCASALFARLHGMAGLPSLFLLSLFLGWLQQRTRCLWVPWSVHALHNAVGLAVALAWRGPSLS